jgi:hypothetical protein
MVCISIVIYRNLTLFSLISGWWYGERCRFGDAGWFPSSYVHEVMNDHVRAKNYRQRLLMIQRAQIEQKSVNTDRRLSMTLSSSRLSINSSTLPIPTDDSVNRRRFHNPPLIDRLRRLSNPKSLFQV